MDGCEFLSRLKTSALSPIPVIAITGDSESETWQKTLNPGAWNFVSKPYQSQTLPMKRKAAGNRLLRYAADSLRRSTAALFPCACGRIDAAVFCLCRRNDEARISIQAGHVYEVLARYSAGYRLAPCPEFT